MLNKAQLIGNLGADPDIRTMQSGDKVAMMPVATSESWKEKDTGERKQRTNWHRVVIFDAKLVEVAEKYLSKGSRVFLEGQMQTREYKDNEGNRRFITEVVLQRFRSTLTMLDTKKDGPPAVESADDYGKVTTQEAPAPENVPEGFQEDVPL